MRVRGPWTRGTAGAEVLTRDVGNRPIGYRSSAASASYAYDGDGVHAKTVAQSCYAWGDVRHGPANARPTMPSGGSTYRARRFGALAGRSLNADTVVRDGGSLAG